MSETMTIDAEPAGRRPRSERPTREVHRDPEPQVIVEGVEGISPEAALADAAETIKEQNRATAEARRLQREAEQRAQAAERKAAQSETARATDRQSVVAASLEAAQAEQATARTRFKAAREAGDIDGEAAATEALSSATFRASQAASELEWLKNQPKPAAPQPGPAAPSAAAQRWIDEHPQFHTDDDYKAVVEGGHAAAVRALGAAAVGSEAYVRHVDKFVEKFYGEGHGQGGEPVRRDTQMTEPRSPRGDAAPPSRTTTGGAGGFQRVRTPGGDLLVRKGPDGRLKNLRCTSEAQEAEFRDFAASSKMTFEEYTIDMLRIAEEQAAGETGDIVNGDGRVYR